MVMRVKWWCSPNWQQRFSNSERERTVFLRCTRCLVTAEHAEANMRATLACVLTWMTWSSSNDEMSVKFLKFAGCSFVFHLMSFDVGTNEQFWLRAFWWFRAVRCAQKKTKSRGGWIWLRHLFSCSRSQSKLSINLICTHLSQQHIKHFFVVDEIMMPVGVAWTATNTAQRTPSK